MLYCICVGKAAIKWAQLMCNCVPLYLASVQCYSFTIELIEFMVLAETVSQNCMLIILPSYKSIF